MENGIIILEYNRIISITNIIIIRSRIVSHEGEGKTEICIDRNTPVCKDLCVHLCILICVHLYMSLSRVLFAVHV